MGRRGEGGTDCQDELARTDKCASHCSELRSPLACTEFATAVKLNHIDKGVCSGADLQLQNVYSSFSIVKM